MKTLELIANMIEFFFLIRSKIDFDRTKMTRKISGILWNRPKTPKYPKYGQKDKNKGQIKKLKIKVF